MQSLSDPTPTKSPTESPADLEGSDESLVARVLDGEKDAFAVLVRRYNQRIYRIARSILRDEAEAEDVAQQTMVLAYQKLGQWKKISTYSRWLTRIAANEAYARLRKRKRARENQAATSYHDDNDSGPEMALARQQVATQIELAVDDLPPDHRSVFVLRDVEELNTAETAVALEISEVSVR
ncbi:MAG: sigma-70 family RNA polymerase sigma factor, partial [Kofleriaceae bacterium]|nr:sigma-70 family RNA polymerase sigma factor [Kofleriaceae bacterium]